MKTNKETIISVYNNKKAYHDYEILEKFTAGIALTGTEIKSVRLGKMSLADAYINIEQGELFMHSSNIAPYTHGNIYNHDPLRIRKLLVTKMEILKLTGKIKEKGLTLIPLSAYFKGRWMKIDFALTKGKKLYDKRATIAERDVKREIDRAMKHKF